MTIRLKDIIDLDYLLNIDEQRDSDQEKEEISARDRDIYKQLDPTGMDEKKLLSAWLEYRKLVFFDDREEKKSKILPGLTFSMLYRWMVWFLLISGFAAGIALVYSFLAYHGTRPVNVTLFFVVFVLVQLLFSFLTLALLLARYFKAKSGKARVYRSMIHTLIFSLFFHGLPWLMKKTGWQIFGKSLDLLEYLASFISMKKKEYGQIFFFPFFILSSVFAFSFSWGALAGTLFRVVISDMAFGWQSSLVASSARVYDLVSGLALPWAWFVPQELAYPGLEQIQGSRIILKQGIASLATENLVSWWPFLCFGILFYAILPRFLLIVAGLTAQKAALDKFDFNRPRFRKLIIRMQSPVLDIRFKEEPATMAARNNIFADQTSARAFVQDISSSTPGQTPGPGDGQTGAGQAGNPAAVICSSSVYGDAALGTILPFLRQKFFFDVPRIIDISFDYDIDKDLLLPVAHNGADPVIVLQEVWQPPIRGLLYYFVQLKTGVLKDKALWIFLTQTPGQENFFVDNKDVNFQVWKKAVHKLGHPDIIVERIYR